MGFEYKFRYGRTDINVKKLGFGMMRLPKYNEENNRNVDMRATSDMIDRFLENGFTYFDTAYMYHNYCSEDIVRRLLVERHPRSSFTLADKMPTMFLKNAEQMPGIFRLQLKKCGVEYFDYYMMHDVNSSNYDSVVQAFDGFGFIAEQKKLGRVREIGFSFHDDAVLLERVLTDHPEVDFVQLQINYLDWEDEGIQSRKCYDCAVRHGKKVIVMEPVKGGTLANIPEAARLVFKSHNADASVASWAIRFAASLPNVFMVLSGMSNDAQLDDNMSYMKDFAPLNDEEYKVIDKVSQVLRGAVEIPCTSCGYCLDAGCPMDIQIPKYFTLFNTEKLLGSCDFSTHEEYYANATEKHGKASACIKCGKCERACPQHIKIRDQLVRVAQLFESL